MPTDLSKDTTAILRERAGRTAVTFTSNEPEPVDFDTYEDAVHEYEHQRRRGDYWLTVAIGEAITIAVLIAIAL